MLAAALAGCAAFAIACAFDWLWQIPVLAVSALLLAAVLVSAPADVGDDQQGVIEQERGTRAFLPILARVATVVVALGVILVIAVPLASTSLLRSSQDEVQRSDLSAALEDAKTAVAIEPFAASPRLQEALVLEHEGALADAAIQARKATLAESTNWRTWLVLSRIEAKRGNAGAALAAYRRAKSLNPRSPIFSS